MSDTTVQVGKGSKSKSGGDLLRGLPPWMPTDVDSENFKLLDVVGQAIDRLDEDVDDLDHATTVQKAQSIEELEQLAKLVDLPHKNGESLKKYRSRTVANFQVNSAEGTPGELIKNTATILGISTDNVSFDENPNTESGVIEISVPLSSLDSNNLTETELVDILKDQVAAGYRIRLPVLGTFTYLGESAYSGPYDSANGGYDSTQLSSDASRGHDGLDNNGDPKNNGGTYSGLIGS